VHKKVCIFLVLRRYLCNFEKQIFVVGFEAFTLVTMKIAVFWDVPPCGSCTNRRFGGT
jgi:hypothetical protein